jgi:hypothetical protein
LANGSGRWCAADLSRHAEYCGTSGVNVMITIFANFRSEKIGVLSKTNVMIKFFHNLALFLVKNANFFHRFFGRKYFKNHNIGPWSQSYDFMDMDILKSRIMSHDTYNQGCQMVSFQTKNPNLGKLWRTLDGKVLINFSIV